MITVPKIEMHLAHACNLRCEGCTHYSNYGIPGVVSMAEGGPWLRDWSRRVRPVHLSFLGGEPLLNAELPAFLKLARQLWPDARMRLVSNALLLPRWEGIWPILAATRTLLTVSIHSREPDYVARLVPILEHARSRAMEHGVALEERDAVERWYKLYRGSGPTMEPFEDKNPMASWRVCQNRHCVTLQDNALWKCPPLAHLPRVAARFGLARLPSWQSYLSYTPLSLEASDDEIIAFFARGPEPSCGMCPARLTYFEKSVR